MLRFFLKKRIFTKSIKSILKFYYNYSINTYIYWNTNYFNLSLINSVPSRQHNISIYFKNKNKNLLHIFSAGRIVKIGKVNVKFFKKSIKSNSGVIVYLQNLYSLYLKYIYLYYIKNFNYRQWIFLKKFYTIINPYIFYLIHKQSYQPHYIPVRRIKRKIIKLLN